MRSSYMAPGVPQLEDGAAELQEIEVAGCRLTTAKWGRGTPDVVMLHDGLGSISQWRSVPAELARRTGHTIVAYDRAGHGRSLPVPHGPWPPDWLHREAEVLAALLCSVGAEDPVLVGHSDGATIAALHAASARHDGPLVLLAAHTWVERVAAEEIARMRRGREVIVERLARFHARPLELFEAWSGVWTSSVFGRWDIRPLLGTIEAPTLVLQGEKDEFATADQAFETAAAIGANATCRLIDDVGHLIHHHRPDLVIDQIVGFIDVPDA